MNDPKVFSNPCAICRVREATKLCDYVIRYDNSIIFFRDYEMFHEANTRTKNETCDLPLCEKCSKEIGVNVDVCPHHYNLHLRAELPPKLKKIQLRYKTKQLEDYLKSRE